MIFSIFSFRFIQKKLNPVDPDAKLEKNGDENERHAL